MSDLDDFALPLTPEEQLLLLIGIRGGLPEKCDFCGEPYGESRYPVPEEAGEWACSECLKRRERGR